MQNLPIGIFDSGIGGLTVAHALKKNLPNESIIYFGDTEHLPYGEKSNEAIKNFSKVITHFLIEKNCKAIVIACNSASSVAFEAVKQKAKNIPVFNVIDPVANNIASSLSDCKIGVIGTKTTIQSKIYTKKINALKKSITVSSLATPLLVPMIEEGFINEQISNTIISKYLSNKSLRNINSLILACTHYPLIYNEIYSFYKGKVTLVNSAKIVAESIKEELKNLDLLNIDNNPSYQFFISNYTKSFAKSAQFFFQEEINIESINIWN